jgi:2-oxoglutarate dehydrogenase E1 component
MPPNLRYAWITQQGIGRELDPSAYGLTDADMNRVFTAPLSFDPPQAPLKDIIAKLQQVYAGTMGSEILHIRNRPMRRWLFDQLENRVKLKTWKDEELRRWQRDLIRAEEFESFVHSRFTGQKRFSLEGTEVVIPALRYLFTESGRRNVTDIIMGMAHRGRLNVLVNAMRKPASEIFAMFEGNYVPHTYGGSGDVKYHMGQSTDLDIGGGRSVHIGLVSNPSHLEASDPVVEGKARGTQRLKNDRTRKKVLPVLIHGDAAFSGQGVIAETFNLSQLRGYRTGGTIHIIVNNQIGFTTAGADSRSTFFATDIAKAMPVPVFHANGDEPESVMWAMELALRWRQKFGQDVVVDIVGYRRLGHNEADEPSFTHPIMYNLIRQHETVSKIYGRVLDERSVYPEKEQEDFRRSYIDELKEAREQAGKLKDYHGFQALTGGWAAIKRGYSFDFPETGVAAQKLQSIAEHLHRIPDGFRIHPKLERFIRGREEAMESGEGIDWSFAESLAFGSLLTEGYSVRLSGEDCGRGTFSQRHAVWWDVDSETPRQYTPLSSLAEDKARFSVYDSPLSEFSILGFEYGYSITVPDALVLWEAQFGDFANGAQVIIDQFVSAGESKWARHSGLVMLLPHAFEGQGPEHSNAYLERYLTLCAEDNLQVANLTTPAQYFHILRKQQHQNFRKPLILMTPKSLLRLPVARSSLKDLASGRFETVLDDYAEIPRPERMVVCSGHLWYDLDSRRRELVSADPDGPAAATVIIRLEQIYPFPEKRLSEMIAAKAGVKTWIWAQEEPANRGAWTFAAPRLAAITGSQWIYAGRPPSASPATGSHGKHIEERDSLISEALGLNPAGRKK